jgi:TRAP-type C4-dicarboxylate transport system permease small subunit
VHEITEVLAAAAFVIGGPYVHAARRHIAITYFYERMPSSIHGVVTLLISLLTLGFLLFLSYAAIDQAMMSIRDMETSGTALNTHSPMFLKILFAVACVALTVQTIVHVLVDIIALKEHQK